ncbi:nitroreductase family protein [Streptomyces sp. SID3343]|uniref:nitroreductase family protein n=1 Tax=Streptomyces sp. SID3343 TaxID=2690260 RepID=UPI001370BCAC|nr:nitroreductase family protein [Streptomyces sp. SID3343]MYV99083.1 nitroreductase [Streptomyces sp. SID3343]
MELHEALYTTRAMRRVGTDPVPYDVQARILDAAVRAPSGGNTQGWRFLLVDDPAVKDRLGPLYREAIDTLWKTVYAPRVAAAAADPDSAESRQFLRVQRSSQWLADNFERVPLFLFGFVQHDPTGGSIFPAVWSAMLAARAEGVGTALTAVLGIGHRDAVMEVLGVPPGRGWHMSCCVSFGYPTGRWDVAPRTSAHEVAYRNTWGESVGFEVPEPLWPANGAAYVANSLAGEAE